MKIRMKSPRKLFWQIIHSRFLTYSGLLLKSLLLNWD
ncbi:hypothetical protein KSF78_0001729 [Schistosoma japonicum]|nr:hypothetical protein KSF78_0001729 [Schistosoma japonicum]KAH8854613.1 hypothetical protein KSF78_0001729 [Schistosoma japonicum]